MSVTASLDLALGNIQCLGSCISGSREGNPLPTRSLLEGLLLRTLSLGHDTAGRVTEFGLVAYRCPKQSIGAAEAVRCSQSIISTDDASEDLKLDARRIKVFY